MRRIDRDSVERPACLDQWDHQTHDWERFRGPCKQSVADALTTSQHGLCAYCERKLHGDAHIEHFRRKNPKHFAELTFEWTNLFRSCGQVQAETCGHHKDAETTAAYRPDDLIKPDEDHPDHFLHFHSDGHVRPRAGLSPTDLTRAQISIEVFNLNHAGLRGERARIGKRVRRDLERLVATVEDAFDDPDECSACLAIELAEWAQHESTLQLGAHLGATARHLYSPVPTLVGGP